MADKRITDLPLILSGDISSLDVLPIVNVELDITNKVTTDQLKAYINSGFTDVFVTGGTYNTTTGVATFTNNTGGTFSITGFYTGSTDVFVTGGTYSNGTTTFTNNTGGTFNVVGYYTGETSYVNSITTGTGLSGDSTTGNITLVNTLPDQIVTITGGTNLSIVGTYPNFGVEFTGATSSFFTGGTVSGATNFTNGLSADTFSATTISGGTLYGDGSNLTGIPDYYLTGLTFDNGTYILEASVNDGNNYFANLSIFGGDLRVTGGTYNPATGIGTFTNNSGATFDVSGFLVGYTDHYVTGFTYDNINTFTIYDNSGNTFSASINNLSATTISATTISATTYQNLPIDPDTYVTGYTYNNNTFTIKQNNGQPDLTATINSVTGLTVNGNLTVTGTTSLQGLSATTISATTIGSSGDCIDDIYVSNIHSCSPLNINPLSEGNVFFGSSVSGVTIDTTNNRLGIGTSTPQTTLELTSNNNTLIGNVLRFRDSDNIVTPLTEQFIGKIEFSSNETTGGGGIKAYVGGIQNGTGSGSIIFATTGSTGSLTGSSTTLIGERMRIDSVGNIGIGTTTPSGRLDVRALNATPGDIGIKLRDSANTKDLFSVSNTGTLKLTQLAYTGELQVYFSANNVLRFNHTGVGQFMTVGALNVVNFEGQTIQALARGGQFGSSVTNFPYALNISGIPAASSGTVNVDALRINPSINNTGTYSGIVRGIFYNPTLTSLVGTTHRAIETTTGDVLFGTTSGNVGIGITSPTAKLHITKNSASPNIIVSDNGSSANDSYIRFLGTSGGSETYSVGIDKSDSTKFKINYDPATNANPSNGVSRLTIDTSGVISIPTDGTPVVNIGSTNQMRLSTSSSSSQIRLFNGAAGTLKTDLTQYSNYSALEANVGLQSNRVLYIENSSPSGATIFRNGTDDIYIYPDGTTNVNGGSGTNFTKNLYVNGSFGLGIPVATGSGSQMYRNGTTGVLGPLISDARVKQNIETIPNALSIVKNLRGVFFDWKDSDDIDTSGAAKQIGLIAQEVEEFLPEAVIDSGVKDYKTVRYSEMVSVLIEAIKEQQNQIDELKNQIEILKNGL